MLSLSDLKDVIATQSQRIKEKQTYSRELLKELELIPDFALVISGIRRCGKSTLVTQFMLKQNKKCLFINFDSPKLYQFTFEDFRLVDDFLKTDKLIKILFFDEIQVVEGWEIYVRGKLDEGYLIVVTGSNASLLSRELGTKLTGRHIPKELFPFSFSEYSGFNSLPKNADTVMMYLQYGGFPQYLKTQNIEILSILINDILYRDISVRFNLRDDKTLKNLLMFVVANVGNLISANKLKQVIGVKSTATVQEYLSFLEDTYLLQLVSKFAWSYKRQLVNPRKIYFIDNGLQSAISPSATEDWGRKFENMVFWEVRRLNKEVYYFNENGHECDFVVCRNSRPVMLIQVCFELNNDNRKREINGLREAMEYFKIAEGYIITTNQTDKIIVNNNTIHILPFHSFDAKKFLDTTN